MVHDFAQKVDALNADIKPFLVSPTRWRTSRVTTPLTWTFLSFTEANRTNVPLAAGVYAFVVRHENNHFPAHGFIMYIGITGANANGRTLRDRYGDYLREQKKKKRPRIHYMLTKYKQDIHFAYCATDPAVNLETLELDLNDAIIPPAVSKDFTAEIRQLRKALQ